MLCLIYEYVERTQPDEIWQVGDLYDMLAQASSRMPKSMNIYNPFEEKAIGRKMAEDFWATIRKLAPKAVLKQIKGNHCIRPKKRIQENAPACEPFFDLDSHFVFDGVQTFQDYRDVGRVNDTHVHHGWLSELGAHLSHFVASGEPGNVVHGHSHRAGIHYRPYRGRLLWEMDVGWVGDQDSKAFDYMPTKFNKWTKAFGMEDVLGPRIICGT